MDNITLCKVDGTPLILKQTKRSPQQLKKPFYYTAYYLCQRCGRMYFNEKFKQVNQNFDLFTSKSLLSDDPFDIEIWTDGASSNNGKPNAKASWAYVSGKHEEAGLVDGKQTNNRGEALAIYYALKWAASEGYKKIKINTDSQITIHGVMKHPDMVKENRDIFQRIHNVVTTNDLHVEYQKVLGHSGDENNDRADKLAVRLTLQ